VSIDVGSVLDSARCPASFGYRQTTQTQPREDQPATQRTEVRFSTMTHSISARGCMPRWVGVGCTPASLVATTSSTSRSIPLASQASSQSLPFLMLGVCAFQIRDCCSDALRSDHGLHSAFVPRLSLHTLASCGSGTTAGYFPDKPPSYAYNIVSPDRMGSVRQRDQDLSRCVCVPPDGGPDERKVIMSQALKNVGGRRAVHGSAPAPMVARSAQLLEQAPRLLTISSRHLHGERSCSRGSCAPRGAPGWDPGLSRGSSTRQNPSFWRQSQRHSLRRRRAIHLQPMEPFLVAERSRR
jgi:hypothetical protein